MAKLAGILLAAGESTRMGSSKALLPWLSDEPLVSFQTRCLYSAGFDPIIVVLGHDADLIKIDVPQLPGVTIIRNHSYQQGRSTSVISGVKSLPSDIDAVTILNVDSPRTPDMLAQLRKTYEQSAPLLMVLSYQGTPGHPWMFSKQLVAEILLITEEGRGLREVEKRYESEQYLVESSSPLALANINTASEYAAVLKLAQKNPFESS